MYTIGDTVYADAGNMLLGKNRRGYQFKGDINEFTEVPVVIDDMKYDGRFLTFNNGQNRALIEPKTTYPELKGRFVKIRYSNDDQLAIMLNKDESDEDLLKFERMQAWRKWAGMLAKTIVSKINERNI